MNQHIPQTPTELEQHLSDHTRFLQSSAEGFDSGFEGEAKRLAVSLRVLLHDTASSHSLLGQLNRLSDQFLSTATPHEPGNLLTHGGLIMIAASGQGSRFVAMLDDVPITRHMGFTEWWNELVFVDDQRRTLSRKQLVTTTANQDGGAHVDPALDGTYARLSRHNSLGWRVNDDSGSILIPGAAQAAIRQITHEVLKYLIPEYVRMPSYNADVFLGGAALTHGNDLVPQVERQIKVGRNAPCPCGSGKKYKKCHGAASR